MACDLIGPPSPARGSHVRLRDGAEGWVPSGTVVTHALPPGADATRLVSGSQAVLLPEDDASAAVEIEIDAIEDASRVTARLIATGELTSVLADRVRPRSDLTYRVLA